MGAGRPRKPDALHIADGTYQPCRHGDDETLKFRPDGEPECPDHLSGPAGELWAMIVPKLVSLGVATYADTWELISMCEWWGRYRSVSEALEEMEPSEGGYYKTTITASMCWKNFSTIAARFGLNPSDRAKLRIPKQEDKSDGKGRFFA